MECALLSQVAIENTPLVKDVVPLLFFPLHKPRERATLVLMSQASIYRDPAYTSPKLPVDVCLHWADCPMQPT